MEKISAKKILYIKLGESGNWEQECIKKNEKEKGYLKIGFRKTNHSDCLSGNWDNIHDFYLNEEKKNKGTATNFLRQIKSFYEEPDDTLWITFTDKKMWWCFAEKEVIQNEDGTKIRYVKKEYPWSDKDIKGDDLNEDRINGGLRTVQSYRQTICNVPTEEYVIRKINCTIPQNVLDAENAKKELEKKLVNLIHGLQWHDFELLIDLIFSHAGWQRIAPIGGVNKDLDLELIAPITNERVGVQIKSKSTISEFEEFIKKTNDYNYHKLFYVIHQDEAFKDYKNDSKIALVLLDEIVKFTINAGLIEWVIKKAF